MLPKIPRLAIYAGIAATLLLLIAGGRSYLEKLDTARADAANARAATTVALATAAKDSALAAGFRSQALLLADSSKKSVAKAIVLEQKAAGLQAVYTAKAAAAPDTCRSVIAAADSVIASQDSTITTLHTAVRLAQDGETKAIQALDSTSAALTVLRASSANLVHADATLSTASKPSFFKKILPHPAIGAAIGFDALGVPHLIVGLTLGWSL